MDILFLTVSIGAGHMKAAESVKNHVQQKYPGSRAMIVDTLKYINPLIDKLVIGGYLNAVRRTPQIYGKLYELSESGDNIYYLSGAVNRILSLKLIRLIKEFSPSVIVCTHPFPLQMISGLKAKKEISTPTMAILTDYVSHPMWLHENVDSYVVAHEGMKQEMIRKGVPHEIIYPFGIPVSDTFLQKKNKKAVLEEIGLEDKPTALIMGGSLGLGEIENTFLSLLHNKSDHQIIAVAGMNEKLMKQLQSYSLGSDKKVKVVGFTDKISDLMDAADILVTKPGGMTISEALAKELPIFVISPLPGHEEGNADFLVKNGLAVKSSSISELGRDIQHVMNNPHRIRHMKEMAKQLYKLNSSENTVNLMKSLVDMHDPDIRSGVI